MRQVLMLVGLLFFSFSANAFDHTHKTWSDILKKYQTNTGLVRYGQLKTDLQSEKSHPFKQYTTSLQNVPHAEFEKWSKEEKQAFLINAYNAFTVQLIVDNYPVPSIKKIGGFFKKPWDIEFFSLLDGKIKSLDPIEHKWLRPMYKDFRVHAAVNCASFSCPPLRNEAFEGTKLNAQLEEQMRLWLSDKTRNDIQAANKVFKVSMIFKWYKSDFEDWGGGVVNVINKYSPKPLSRDLANAVKIEYLDYNWDLNEAK